MERWGISTYFTLSISMAEYSPAIADRLFVWPNFVDPDVFCDYGEKKTISVLITGSHALHYPWRNRINKLISKSLPTLTCPHFGWFDAGAASRTVFDEPYARLIGISFVAPTCGTIAKEVVRKHLEIPACKSLLITEETQGLKEGEFVDMKNCVFVNEANVLDKLDYLFKNLEVIDNISREGYRLIHSRHTLKNRGQLLEWLQLHRNLRPNESIIQTGPFGSLAIADGTFALTNYHVFSNGIDRDILRRDTKNFVSVIT